jgi:fructosamine-3-kinase
MYILQMHALAPAHFIQCICMCAQHRLGHMLRLCERNGATYSREAELRAKVRELLSRVDVKPALLHGDLWTGNAGFTSDGEGCIFDPGQQACACAQLTECCCICCICVCVF